MSDIKLQITDTGFDIGLENNDLVQDDGLQTAVIISLFTDRRVTAEELPSGEEDRRGWWADALNADNDLTGSKLWLLAREKITPEILTKAREYCEEALQWLIDDKIAESVAVSVQREGLYQVKIRIQVQKPKDKISRRYEFVWSGNAL